MKTLRLFIFALLMQAGTALAAERIITDAAGRQVSVPSAPRRVLAMSELDLDALLALGVKPAGATRGRGQQAMPRYLGKAAAAIPSVGNFASPVPELALALQPDLILAGGIPDPALLARLSRIAPTVVTYRPGDHWQGAFRRVAGAVGKSTQGDAVLAGYQRRAAALRARLQGQTSASVSVVRWNPQGPAYMLRDSFASLVLADLQLRRPASQQQPGAAHSPPLSMESLSLIDGDWLFVGTLDGAGAASRAMQAAAVNPAFGRLGAVKQGHMRAVDGSLWTGPGGPLAANAILADIEKAMLQP
ncbi:ABC transporter substrate-binding protein [Massilia sp. PAMC28688]|uniref:ABC transporter substrate-binding protein n=1 Tax=Massilia sp. PAMC28688 TaxID=2861283 RepID=UPI001C62CBA3|nr:ABC transporter substrate-binding protein [Massilia sp. PAMC28688]QYF95648.1 ABC transporter substrate-binding protein [Massilia sp. PAMC28688]